MSDRRARMSADSQALALVDAMREVGRNLERRRTALQGTADARRRDALRQALLKDLDRLSNLVTLSSGLSTTDLRPQTMEIMEGTVSSLRDRMRQIGSEVTLERLHELHSSAREWTRSNSHPLGKSLSLREEFLRNVTYLRSMAAGVSGANQAMLADTVDTINTLINQDRDSSWLRSFSDDPPINFIDPRVAEFEEQDGDGNAP